MAIAPFRQPLPTRLSTRPSSPKLQHRRRSYLWKIVIGISFLPMLATPVWGQEFDPSLDEPADVEVDTPAAAAPPLTRAIYFADVLVRGQPVFQVGSTGEISAPERAQIINRRIASLLATSESPEPVTVQVHPSGEWAALQANSRVLMTVTLQDAQDFGLTIDELAERWANQLNQAFNRPPFAVDVVQRLNVTMRDLVRSVIDNLPSLAGALIVVFGTWAIAKGMRSLAYTWAHQTEGDRGTEILIGRLGYGGVWVVGTMVALGVMGLDFGALLGALGLTSVAIGFSLKDVLSNYISGVILLAARPFRLGDQVVIGDYEGTIIQIQLRAMTMKTYDGRTVYIPNQRVFQASITNNTASTSRRSYVIIGIDYDADISTAIQVIETAVQRVPGVESEPAPEVLVQELAASTVNLKVLFWVDSRRFEFLQATSKVAQAIKESLQQQDIEMPTEIYTVAFRNGTPELKLPSSERSENPAEFRLERSDNR